jgi:hypothetical protein
MHYLSSVRFFEIVEATQVFKNPPFGLRLNYYDLVNKTNSLNLSQPLNDDDIKTFLSTSKDTGALQNMNMLYCLVHPGTNSGLNFLADAISNGELPSLYLLTIQLEGEETVFDHSHLKHACRAHRPYIRLKYTFKAIP